MLSLYLGDDQPDTLDHINIYGKNKNITWAVNASDTKFFASYPEHLAKAVSTEDVALHAHSYSVSVDTYNNIPKMKTFMKITQTDIYTDPTGRKVEFINAMESNDYPIFTFMYHPEYQLLKFYGPKKWQLAKDRKVAEEVAFRASLQLNREARKNTNKPNTSFASLYSSYGVSRVPSQQYPMVKELEIQAYGYSQWSNEYNTNTK